MKNRIILHIDFDSFFASVEQQLHPELRGKPLGVTATNGRTCIIASSREAKRLGIGTATNTVKAQQLCPTINLVPADFNKYWEVSKKFISICKDYSPFVEVFSIDELFMDVTDTAYLFGGTSMLIRRMKQRMRKEIGEILTVSVGVSHNKLLAKLGSGLRKPDGLVYIGLDNIDEIYGQAALSDICGIGPRIETRLHAMGIYTLLQLRQAPLPYLIAEFGTVEGRFLKHVGQGIDPRPVVPYTEEIPVKSVGRQYCLPENEYDERVILQNIYELCEEVGIKLRKLGKAAKRVGVHVKGQTWEGGQITWNHFIDSGRDLFEACTKIFSQPPIPSARNPLLDTGLDENFLSSSGLTGNESIFSFTHSWRHDESWYGRKIGVWAGWLVDKKTLPLSIFDTDRKHSQISAVMDSINEKFGDHTIRNGFLLYADKLTTVPNGYLADRAERIELQSFGQDKD